MEGEPETKPLESPPNTRETWENIEIPEDDEDAFPWSWMRWCPTSRFALRKAEENLLSFVQAEIHFGFVNIGNFSTLPEEPVRVWTAALHKGRPGTPLVLIHGFASGLGLWALNYDGLASSKDRPIYAFDMPGFGQSSRPAFSSDPAEAEKQFIMYMEAWRVKMKLDKMILLGHSMGAFLVFSYALKYPQRVSHIILADPWGISEKPEDLSELHHIPASHRLIVRVLDTLPLNPLWTVRLCGPMGAEFLKRVRMDLISNFLHVLDDAPSKVANYIFHCNVQKPTTGESAYLAMMVTFGWAKNPLCRRLHHLDPDMPMTLIYGSRSWVDHYPAEKIRDARAPSYVGYHVLVSGHHVYADCNEAFNEVILGACKVEKNESKLVSGPKNFEENESSESDSECENEMEKELKEIFPAVTPGALSIP